jgi:hypothetical protein
MVGTPERFPHRHNADKSYDSICPHCFLTVATTPKEADLRAVESRHVCDPVSKYRVSQGYSDSPVILS